ncbi:MAG: hypothetical protein AAGA66_10655 [Bacteroidota bacterium]
MKNKMLIMLSLIISMHTGHSQDRKNQTNWASFKSLANDLGLCIYSIETSGCSPSDSILEALEDKQKNGEVFYFELDTNWANRRIRDWAIRNKSETEDYVMIYDIDQGYKRSIDERAASTHFSMFAILDKRLDYELVHIQAERGSMIKINANKENSIMNNTLWREFMSGRLGKLDTSLDIRFSGQVSQKVFEKFENYLMRALE